MNEDFYISLIYKELDQSISEKEGAELNNWRAESIENEKQYQAVRLAWNSADQLKVEAENLDADAAFDELMAKVDKHTLASVSTPKKVPVDQYSIPKRRNDWVRIAAGIALLIGVGMMAYHFVFRSPVVEMVEIITKEQDSIVDLPDGSKITLAAHSHLSYPESFSDDSRKVYLNKGTAYFEIEPNPNRAFIVETAQEQVEVLGTKFIVDISGKLHKVWVTEGKVSYRISDTQKAIILTKGQTGVVNLSQNTIKQRATNEEDVSWFKPALHFKETSLGEVISALENYYEVDIEIENKIMEKCPLTSTFENEKIEEVLASLEVIFGFELKKIEANVYLLQEGSCQ